jgi:hypothetical protein
MEKQDGEKRRPKPKQTELQLGAADEVHAWAAGAIKEMERRCVLSCAAALEREALELRAAAAKGRP